MSDLAISDPANWLEGSIAVLGNLIKDEIFLDVEDGPYLNPTYALSLIELAYISRVAEHPRFLAQALIRLAAASVFIKVAEAHYESNENQITE